MPNLRPPWALLLATAALGSSGCGNEAGGVAQLSQERGCMRCHGMVTKFVGPGFQQVADRYRGDATATARLSAKIMQGSVGTWGNVIMPRQPQVSAAEASALAGWVLALPPAH
ncbi:c-type cytochrome [Pseudorhodoferax sp. Leaf265]|uniref:c-type cytochrome n=1 Tax=Pseudorhodoferax sp. Leaf265 TaxID=1736315 RepID=UPI001F43304A|nr:c-type cytochrome [Pseudorhodoferax sp. Leaf265]